MNKIKYFCLFLAAWVMVFITMKYVFYVEDIMAEFQPQQEGLPGETITYNFTVENLGNKGDSASPVLQNFQGLNLVGLC